MMDIYCPRCGEPTDIDYLHEVALVREENGTPGATFRDVMRDYQCRGCVALGDSQCDPADNPRAAFMALAAGAMFDVCGDDIDGAASLLGDLAW